MPTAASDVATALSDAARSTPGVSTLRTRSALVVVEIALAVVLLIAGGLTVRSFANLRQLAEIRRLIRLMAQETRLGALPGPTESS